MNWIKENAILTALLGLVAVGTVALVILILGAKSTYDEASTTYDRQAAELGTLQRKEPYPNRENLTAMEEAAREQRAAVDQLQATLAALELPIPKLSPEEFQKSLTASVASVTEKARQNGVNLPATFYLGFESYQAQLPSQDLAPLLGRQLAAIQFLVSSLLDNKPISLDEIKRVPLPLEGGARTPAAKPAPNTDGAPEAKAASDLVEHQPFSINATIDPIRLRRFLNEIAGTPKQFFILRNLQIANLQPKSPPRATPPNLPAPPPEIEGEEAAPVDQTSQPAVKREYLFGNEKITAKMLIDIVDFAEPAAPEK